MTDSAEASDAEGLAAADQRAAVRERYGGIAAATDDCCGDEEC